jgi:hypothetical protein
MGNKCYYGLQNLPKSKLLPKDTCKIHKILMKQAVVYGSESWTLTKLNEDKLKMDYAK